MLLLATDICASHAAESVVVLGEDREKHTLGAHIEYIEDPQGTLTLGDVAASGNTAFQWRHTAGTTPSFGYTSSVYWLRVGLHNAAVQERNLLLEIRNPRIDEIQVYVLRAGQLSDAYFSGDSLPFVHRPIEHRNFLFPISMAGAGDAQIYLRLRSDSLLATPVLLWDRTAFSVHETRTSTLHGFFFGLLLVLVLCNGLLLLVVRGASLLYYIGFLVATLLLTLAWAGYGYQYFWSDWPAVNSRAIGLFALISVAFEALFIRRFLRVRRLSRRASRYFGVLVALAALALLVGVAAPGEQLGPWISLLMLLVSFSGFAAGLEAWLRGVSVAAPFAVGAASLAVTRLMMVLYTAGLVQWTEIVYLSVQATLSAAISAWALAVALRLRRQSMAVGDAARESLPADDESYENWAHEELDDLLSRAPRIRRARSEFENDRLAAPGATNFDALTGVRSRHWFDDRYVSLWRRAVRGKRPLSLLLIDLDDFKSINARFGYRVGDACLKAAAEILTRTATGASEAVARYGGEEFAILLPETDQARAVALAETLRERIAGVDLSSLGRGLSLSASIGVASLHHNGVLSPDGLLNAADNALYKAKYGGRDRVVVAPASQTGVTRRGTGS